MLDRGRLKSKGDPREVIHDYLTLLFSREQSESDNSNFTNMEKPNVGIDSRILNNNPDVDACCLRRSYNPTEYRWGDGRAIIIDYLMSVGDEGDVFLCDAGDKLTISFMVYFKEDLEKLIYGITIKTVDGITVYGANTRIREIDTENRKKGDLVRIDFDVDVNLIASDYFISLGVAIDDESLDNCAIDRRYDIIHFSVQAKVDDFGVASMHMKFREIAGTSNHLV